MKDDFEMISFRFEKPIVIYPVADVHYGALKHDAQKWTAFCREVEAQENAYLLMNGDYCNNNTRSAVGSPFDDTIRPREQKARMVEYLEPIKHKILCMTSGNHERRSLKDADDDMTYDIACKLGIEDLYRPNSAFVKIGIGERKKPTENRSTALQTYVLCCVHGTGGGIYTGGSVNRNERFGNILDNVDCLVVGHTHKPTVTRPAKLVCDIRTNKVTVQDYLVISCTSWQTYGDYALQKMLLPTSVSRPQKLLLNDKIKDIEVVW